MIGAGSNRRPLVSDQVQLPPPPSGPAGGLRLAGRSKGRLWRRFLRRCFLRSRLGSRRLLLLRIGRGGLGSILLLAAGAAAPRLRGLLRRLHGIRFRWRDGLGLFRCRPPRRPRPALPPSCATAAAASAWAPPRQLPRRPLRRREEPRVPASPAPARQRRGVSGAAVSASPRRPVRRRFGSRRIGSRGCLDGRSLLGRAVLPAPAARRLRRLRFVRLPRPRLRPRALFPRRLRGRGRPGCVLHLPGFRERLSNARCRAVANRRAGAGPRPHARRRGGSAGSACG